MKRLVLPALAFPALAFLALSARATVYQPGLWFIHDDTHEWVDESVPVAEWPGAVPCQGTFMEYTKSTDVDPRGSAGQSGTNAYDNAVYTWHKNEMFGYGGQWFVEKGKTYMLSFYHGRYVWCKVDGVRRLYSTGWWNKGDVTWSPSETGWVNFDFRGGINGENYIGPLHNDCGVAFNTENLKYADATWGAPPWQKFLDPGDCSLLRIVKSETDYMTLDSVAVDGDDLAVVASFADVPSEGVLTAFYGASNGGDLPSAWAHSAVLGTVAAGSAASVPYTVPGAAGANFVALRLQRTDYATEPYTQFTAAAPVPKPVPTFDLVCTDVGYTNMTFTAVVASVGVGATAIASASVEIATDDAFSHIVKTIPLSLSTAGSETAYTSGLVSNTVYYARVAGSNNANASNVSATVGPLQTLLPTMSTSTIAALDPKLGALNAAVTVTDWGLDSTGARVRLEASETSGFGVLAGVSEEVDATLGVATNLQVSGLAENAGYHLRARIVNSWGFVEYRALSGVQTTRGLPFVGTPLVWETGENGTLSVHERLLDNEFAGEAELFLDGVSQGVRAFPAEPGRLSWAGLAQPAHSTLARVVVYVVVSGRPYRAEWSDTVVPGTASYLERKWVYDPSAKTLTWVDSYPFTNVVKKVTANGSELTLGDNRGNPQAVNLDFSPDVADGWTIVEIVGEGPFNGSSSVTNIVFPPTMRKVGRAAFEGNKILRAAILNEGLENLGTDSGANNCFNGCSALETIGHVPSTLKVAGTRVFAYCPALTNDIVWPRGVPVVPSYAFYGSSIRSFKAAYGVTHLGPYGSGDGRAFGGDNDIKTIDLPVTLQYFSGRCFSDTSAGKGFNVNIWYRGFPKLGWSKDLWSNAPQGVTTVTNWFEWHHRDEFRAFAETNKQFTIHLPETYTGEGTWAASGCNQIVRWWKDPDQNPPTVMLLR